MGDGLVRTILLLVGLVRLGIKEQFACLQIPSFGKFNSGKGRQYLIFLQSIERIPLVLTQALDQGTSPGVFVLIKVVLRLVDGSSNWSARTVARTDSMQTPYARGSFGELAEAPKPFMLSVK